MCFNKLGSRIKKPHLLTTHSLGGVVIFISLQTYRLILGPYWYIYLMQQTLTGQTDIKSPKMLAVDFEVVLPETKYLNF